MIWVNLLHLYQPATTETRKVEEATRKCYLPLVDFLENNPGVNFTVNITGALLEKWEEMGYQDLIKKWEKVVKRGQIELTGTAAYHPLLPLIPIEEAEKQIKENTEILKKYLGENIELKGFFLPEMAYSSAVAQKIKELGFEWIIVDELAYSGSFQKLPQPGSVYKDTNSGLLVIFRSRERSSDYVPRLIYDLSQNKEEGIVVTATDGELYGLRHRDKSNYLAKVAADDNIETRIISSHINTREVEEEVILKRCSWESSEEELKQGEPYSLWYDKHNKIHRKIWELANLVYKLNNKYSHDSNHKWMRRHLTRGLASCTFWWASAKDFSHIFGPYAWNPDEVERGVNELIRSIRSIEDKRSVKDKIKAEKMYIGIKKMLWRSHWTYHWHKLFK